MARKSRNLRSKSSRSKPKIKKKGTSNKAARKVRGKKRDAVKPVSLKRKKSSSVRLVQPGLRVIGTDKSGHLFQIAEGNNLVGRWDPEDGAFPEIDLELVDPEAKISRKHCIIERKGGTVTIEDVGSLNGTYINQSRLLRPGETYSLKDGDEILIGRTLLRFELFKMQSGKSAGKN